MDGRGPSVFGFLSEKPRPGDEGRGVGLLQFVDRVRMTEIPPEGIKLLINLVD